MPICVVGIPPFVYELINKQIPFIKNNVVQVQDFGKKEVNKKFKKDKYKLTNAVLDMAYVDDDYSIEDLHPGIRDNMY